MKIVFMTGGARKEALEFLLEKNENVIAVITPVLSSSNKRFLSVVETALQFGITICPIKREQLKSTIEELSPDILISCGFPYLIEREVLDIVPFAVNLHPSLLPRYRGFRSGPYIIINGEDKTGVTVHFMDEGIDSGDIILQKEIKLTKFDTTRSMQRKTRAIEGPVLYEALRLLKTGKYERIAQDESKATIYTHLRMPEDSLIDWHRPLKQLYNEIRACDPDDYPAHFFVKGEKICIKMWRFGKNEDESDMI
jgi:methionyl-tRNA formyltransferase